MLIGAEDNDSFKFDRVKHKVGSLKEFSGKVKGGIEMAFR